MTTVATRQCFLRFLLTATYHCLLRTTYQTFENSLSLLLQKRLLWPVKNKLLTSAENNLKLPVKKRLPRPVKNMLLPFAENNLPLSVKKRLPWPVKIMLQPSVENNLPLSVEKTRKLLSQKPHENKKRLSAVVTKLECLTFNLWSKLSPRFRLLRPVFSAETSRVGDNRTLIYSVGHHLCSDYNIFMLDQTQYILYMYLVRTSF